MELVHIMHFGYAMVLAVFFLMIWASVVEGKDAPCSFNTLCTCSQNSPDLGIVTCRDVHLPRVPETVNISQVFKLRLENNQLKTLEPFFFQSTGLYTIIITNNPLVVVPEESFLGLETSLWELELSYCQLTEVPNRAIRYLRKLNVLDLTGNDINKILPKNWKGLNANLEKIILAENSITKIPVDAFAGLPLVHTIDLRGNNLREINPSIFRDGMGQLAYLLLGDNQLTAIPYQALHPLKTLRTLDLSYNLINKMTPAIEPGVLAGSFNFNLDLDTLRLDYNQLTVLPTGSFQYFKVVNKTYLDGNPLTVLEPGAFKQARIRELYLRSCGLTNVSPAAFEGLENYLELLDLSGNNLSLLPNEMFLHFQYLRSLTLRDNIVTNWNSMQSFTGFQLSLNRLDLSGTQNTLVNLQDLRRFRSLRSLTLSRLSEPNLSPEKFLEYGTDLEELSITYANLQTVKDHSFKFVHGLRHIDLSDNNIGTVEKNAFVDIGHSLERLCLAHAFSSSTSAIPSESLKMLYNLEHLDLSNNKLRTVGQNSFHFLGKLKKLELQDNVIEEIHKGTFQGEIHTNLEQIYLSFNNIKTISQHTFAHLPELEQLHLDDNRLVSLESRSFINLEGLQRLNLKGNKLVTVPDEVFQNLPKLEHLDMSYNQISMFNFSMFDQVGTLAVFHLNVSHNNLKELSVSVSSNFQRGLGGYRSNIKVLDLSFNNISSISKQFFRPTEISLTRLYLSHNQIMNVTKDVFGNMPHLQWLDLSRNQIYEVDFDMFRNTKHLQILDVSFNRITDIPNDIFRFLTDLRMVDLSNNRIRTLPDNLFRETGMERLDVSHNLLSKMPLSALSQAAAHTLCELDMSWNMISSLSHGGSLTRFKKLNFLDLSYNRLAQIDSGTFKELPKLLYLDLSHNSQLSLEANGGSFQGLEYSLLHLKLDNVSLNAVPVLPTLNLVTLSLAFNFLTNIRNDMVNLTKLQRLNLDYNSLTLIPILIHPMFELRYLSMMSNQVIDLRNTSFMVLADNLEELDIRNFDLTTLEGGAFCKMYSLRTLKMNLYTGFKTFSIPSLLQWSTGLRNLEIHVDKQSNSDLANEMYGDLPPKLRNVTFSGRGLKQIGSKILSGIKFPQLHVCLRNTSVEKIPADLFKNTGNAKNLTIDVRDNAQLRSLMNPSTGSKPDLYRKTFLNDLKMIGNKWDCDCNLGWIEVWQRKHRQYICERSPSDAPFFNHFDYTCRHTHDELRMSLCSNKNNNSVIEVLKTDVECGWSGAVRINQTVYLIFFMFVGTICQVLF